MATVVDYACKVTNATGADARTENRREPMAEPQMPSVLPDDAPPAPSRIDRVGESLRRVFDDAAAEPLPRSFEELLQKLR